MVLLHPTYFPSIAQMVAMVQHEDACFEVEANYQKQTYRTRAYIAHANGKLALNVPIKHSKDGTRQKTKEVLVENNFPWQEQHWKSLQTAYRTSPFFEYYEDELLPLFSEKVDGLIDHHFSILKVVEGLLDTNLNYSLSQTYEKDPKIKDLRYLAVCKNEAVFPLEPYTQVLQSHHGFLSNLSVLDLLFNEGPNALYYLEHQKIDF